MLKHTPLSSINWKDTFGILAGYWENYAIAQ